tara:strand:- start:69 stop:254 length:186 start_codon:yes stop_codon:yes gene_type:complete
MNAMDFTPTNPIHLRAIKSVDYLAEQGLFDRAIKLMVDEKIDPAEIKAVNALLIMAHIREN